MFPMRSQETEPKRRDPQRILLYVMFGVIAALLVLYRFYQPIVAGALLQFDIFDWARQSREIVESGTLVLQHELWAFPVMNAIASLVTGLDIFTVYLFGGAVFTVLNGFLFYSIGRQLFRDSLSPVLLVLLYALAARLLARSINYLPETMTYTLGLALVYFYARLFATRQWRYVGIIIALSYFYYHLHQSGLNFLFFSGLAIMLFILFQAFRSWRWRWLTVAGVIVAVAGIVWFTPPLKQQLVFFLSSGNGSADVAFQGEPIPLEQFWVDFDPLTIFLFVLGSVAALIVLVRRSSGRAQRLTALMVLLIAAFYFSFLYVLPNLNLYRLVPWRFYTWFTLYALLVAGYGIHAIRRVLKGRVMLTASLVALLLYFSLPGSLIADNMYTADRQTLDAMAALPIEASATVLTTNANLLQARYALVGRQVAVVQDHDIFRSTSDTVAVEIITKRYPEPVYILVSLFQLRQRPWSIDYWRNAALINMPVERFRSGTDFETVYEDENVLLVQLRPTALGIAHDR